MHSHRLFLWLVGVILIIITIVSGTLLALTNKKLLSQSQDTRSKAYEADQSYKDGKYTNKQRIGFGFAIQICNSDVLAAECDKDKWQPYLEYFSLSSNEYWRLGAGWYVDWAAGWSTRYNNSFGGPRAQYGMEYMGLVGGYNQTNLPPDNCTASGGNSFTRYVYSHRDKYPAGMMWTVGNEIGWDDQQTPITYANHFAKWYNCLKTIDPSFQVGTGAILPYFALPETNPSDPQIICVSANQRPGMNGLDKYSGQEFLREMVAELRRNPSLKGNQGQTILPDLVINHYYTACRPEGSTGNPWTSPTWGSVPMIHEYVTSMRQVMKDVGMQDKDLIVKEYGPLNENVFGSNPAQAEAGRIKYLRDSFDYFLNTSGNTQLSVKNTQLGNPNDSYRMVQRFAWFVSSGGQFLGGENKYAYVGLYDKNTKRLTALGQTFAQLARQYTGFTPTITANPTPTSSVLPTSTPTRTVTNRPTSTPTRVPTRIPTNVPKNDLGGTVCDTNDQTGAPSGYCYSISMGKSCTDFDRWGRGKGVCINSDGSPNYQFLCCSGPYITPTPIPPVGAGVIPTTVATPTPPRGSESLAVTWAGICKVLSKTNPSMGKIYFTTRVKNQDNKASGVGVPIDFVLAGQTIGSTSIYTNLDPSADRLVMGSTVTMTIPSAGQTWQVGIPGTNKNFIGSTNKLDSCN